MGCRENKGEFEGFLGEEFAEYCSTMERQGTWGDELTLVCAGAFPEAESLLRFLAFFASFTVLCLHDGAVE